MTRGTGTSVRESSPGARADLAVGHAGANDRDAFLRALRRARVGEVVGEIEHRIQALVSLRRSMRERAREFAAAEVDMRGRLEEELAKHGVAIGSTLGVRAISWAVLAPVKVVLPARVWFALAHRIYARAVQSFERQQARFGWRNPELFARLVDHEVRQRDWVRSGGACEPGLGRERV